MRVGYIFVIAELFHYGHLQLITAAKEACDKLICGVLTDEAVQAFRSAPITSYTERKRVVESIRFIDEVIPQHEQNPTENLKQLHSKYCSDELVFVYGDNWPNPPGAEYLSSVNARIIKQRFYERLSNEKIYIKTIIDGLPDQSSIDTFTPRFAVKDFEKFTRTPPSFVVTTKANTLQTLKPLLHKSFIEKTFVFNVADWQQYKPELIDTIAGKFHDETIIVRSSSLREDSQKKSMAGHYYSELNIEANNQRAISRAVDKVIASYDRSDPLHKSNQVLIQKQTENIRLSGVLFTVDLASNAPYYVINYAEGENTDTVTGGLGGKMIKIFRNTSKTLLESPWDTLIDAIDELEQIIHDFSLDVEFAITKDNRIILFQVRPLAANRKAGRIDPLAVERNLQEAERKYSSLQHANNGSKNGALAFSDMLFWNPAELIGHCPGNLAYSIFDRIIMKDAWNTGLVSLGHPCLSPSGLMDRFLYKPYINVNMAFQAMIPSRVPEKLHSKLLPYFIDKLKRHPFLHDKAEFAIMFSCYDFNIASRLQELYVYDFTGEEIENIKEALIDFTKQIIHGYSRIARQLRKKIAVLEQFNSTPLPSLIEKMRTEKSLRIVEDMLDICREYGAIPFVTAARLAFIADALFRSLEREKVINATERENIMNSFSTVASELADSIDSVSKGEMSYTDFLERYGHLRSGTYDIEQPRYDIFFGDSLQAPSRKNSTPEDPCVHPELKKKISNYTRQSPLKTDFETLYQFADHFIREREYLKFVYTKTISNVLEIIREAGNLLEISANDISFLSIDHIVDLFNTPRESILAEVASEKAFLETTRNTILPPLIFQTEDFRVQNYPLTSPNFITGACVEGDVICLNNAEGYSPSEIDGKIVLIENADPGFHWIFAYNIQGLITKYGGICSHMAICCAEFNIPAAIGCGEKYDLYKNFTAIVLNCAGKIIDQKSEKRAYFHQSESIQK